MAATKAIDSVLRRRGRRPRPQAARAALQQLLLPATTRRTSSCSPAPTSSWGPTRRPAERNILGVIGKVGLEIGGAVIKMRAESAEVIEIIGGKAIHPVWACRAASARRSTPRSATASCEIANRARSSSPSSRSGLFDDVVLGNSDYVDLIKSDAFTHRDLLHGYGRREQQGQLLRRQDPRRRPRRQGAREVRGQGLPEPTWPSTSSPTATSCTRTSRASAGRASSTARTRACTGPRRSSRCNAADGMATAAGPGRVRAHVSETLGGKPVHATLATHWARLVELLYAAERRSELATTPTSPTPTCATSRPASSARAWACVEAPRGTLYHHYTTDEKGMVTSRQPHRRHHQQQRRHLDVAQEGGSKA